MTLFAWEFCISIETSHHNLNYKQENTAKRCEAQRLLGFRKMRLIFGMSLITRKNSRKENQFVWHTCIELCTDPRAWSYSVLNSTYKYKNYGTENIKEYTIPHNIIVFDNINNFISPGYYYIGYPKRHHFVGSIWTSFK